MIRVGLIGCGKIADQHIAQIKRIPDCEIVGVCDQEHLMAKQLHERLHGYRHGVRRTIRAPHPKSSHSSLLTPKVPGTEVEPEGLPIIRADLDKVTHATRELQRRPAAEIAVGNGITLDKEEREDLPIVAKL